VSGVLTVTLNPAVDISADIPRLEAGPKLRCGNPHTDPGGGGVNVSRAIARLGGASTPFVAVGGPTGELLVWLLEQEGVSAHRFDIDGLTRQSFAVRETDAGGQYRFVLPGPEWPAARVNAAFEEIVRLAADADYVVVSGSLPPGFSDDFHVRLADAFRAVDVKPVFDVSGPALTRLIADAPPGVACVRLNRREAREVSGRPLPDAMAARGYAEEFVRKGVAAMVIITHGPEGAILATADGAVHVTPPRVETVSAVGAGDSLIGAFVLGLSKGWPSDRALRFGVAAAASAMTTPATMLSDPDETMRLFEALEAENAG